MTGPIFSLGYPTKMYLPALEMACVGYKEFKLINKEKKTNSGKAKSLPTK